MSNFVEELKWRGMIHDIMPGTEEELQKGCTSGYIGFDPTADSLHIGSLVQIMILVHFQKAGHKPYALVGGATGMVGDPSGKSAERNLLDADTLQHNLDCVQKQLEKFLEFNSGENSAVMVNNYDWFKDFSFLDFIRDVGKHITVNYMMAKDSVKNRLESGMSFTEFSYQLVQGYDFYYLNKEHDCKIQLGGSDQWGNIVTGTELIRRKSGNDAFAITSPLIKKADGTKFGKTEGGNVWLDPKKTSPYKFYQYWINSTDEDVKNYIRIFTLLSKEEIEALEKEHNEAPHLRILQKALAEDVTCRVHSREDYEEAVKASEVLFDKNASIEDLSSIIAAVADTIPKVIISKDRFNNSPSVIDLISVDTESFIFPSKGEAKKMTQGGGVSINKSKVEDLSIKPALLQDQYVLVQKGKKNYFLIEVA